MAARLASDDARLAKPAARLAFGLHAALMLGDPRVASASVANLLIVVGCLSVMLTWTPSDPSSNGITR
jgi:hypothetical protein